MQKLDQIYHTLRPYRSILTVIFLLFLLLIAALIITIITSQKIFLSFEHPTSHAITSPTIIPYINKSCQMSISSPIPCGCSMLSYSKIINGQAAKQSAWPWMVSYGPKRIHTCGGTLIAPEYILTAAHCLDSTDEHEPIDITNIEIRIGLTDLTDVTRDNLFSIRKLTLHHDFNPDTYQNDIALIRLDRAVIQSDTIQMLCLPRSTSYTHPPVNSTVTAIGWGHTMDPSINPNANTPTHLQQTSLPVLSINNNRCFDEEIDSPDRQFCAGYADGSSDTCQADSGSPLILFNEQQHWELVGIVSYGVGCAQPLLPGVYTRVSAYLDWINDRIRY